MNEINFRHSGNGYALVQNGVLAPYAWCLDVSGTALPKRLKKTVKVGKTHMDEIPDMINRKEYKVSFFKWFTSFIFTSARAKFDLRDLSGTKAYYNPIIKKRFAKLFCRKRRKG